MPQMTAKLIMQRLMELGASSGWMELETGRVTTIRFVCTKKIFETEIQPRFDPEHPRHDDFNLPLLPNGDLLSWEEVGGSGYRTERTGFGTFAYRVMFYKF